MPGGMKALPGGGVLYSEGLGGAPGADAGGGGLYPPDMGGADAGGGGLYPLDAGGAAAGGGVLYPPDAGGAAAGGGVLYPLDVGGAAAGDGVEAIGSGAGRIVLGVCVGVVVVSVSERSSFCPG